MKQKRHLTHRAVLALAFTVSPVAGLMSGCQPAHFTTNTTAAAVPSAGPVTPSNVTASPPANGTGTGTGSSTPGLATGVTLSGIAHLQGSAFANASVKIVDAVTGANIIAQGAGNIVAQGAGNYRTQDTGSITTDSSGQFTLQAMMTPNEVARIIVSTADGSALTTLVNAAGKSLASATPATYKVADTTLAIHFSIDTTTTVLDGSLSPVLALLFQALGATSFDGTSIFDTSNQIASGVTTTLANDKSLDLSVSKNVNLSSGVQTQASIIESILHSAGVIATVQTAAQSAAKGLTTDALAKVDANGLAAIDIKILNGTQLQIGDQIITLPTPAPVAAGTPATFDNTGGASPPPTVTTTQTDGSTMQASNPSAFSPTITFTYSNGGAYHLLSGNDFGIHISQAAGQDDIQSVTARLSVAGVFTGTSTTSPLANGTTNDPVSPSSALSLVTPPAGPGGSLWSGELMAGLSTPVATVSISEESGTTVIRLVNNTGQTHLTTAGHQTDLATSYLNLGSSPTATIDFTVVSTQNNSVNVNNASIAPPL